MKTTNFFIDYLVVGVILFISLLLPMYTMFPNYLDIVVSYSTKDKSYALPLAMVIIYILGILFNQISDVF